VRDSVERGRPWLDGALLDVKRHEALCFPVAAILKARDIPFIFMTGYDEISSIPPEFRAAPPGERSHPELSPRQNGLPTTIMREERFAADVRLRSSHRAWRDKRRTPLPHPASGPGRRSG
jgi:hypothetical protein